MRKANDSVRSLGAVDASVRARDMPLRTGYDLQLASHLVTSRRLYTHHGIYIGEGRVIHYAGLIRGPSHRRVVEDFLDDFAQGREVLVRCESPCFPAEEVVARARSRLGEQDYRLFSNNCEHFCTWALNGESRSAQLEYVRARLRRVTSRLLVPPFASRKLPTSRPIPWY